MIISSIRISTREKDTHGILDILLSVKGPVEGKPGCLACWIYKDIQDCLKLNYVEVWHSEEGLRRHICSKNFNKILAAIDMSAEPPEIHFSETLPKNGMHFIEHALAIKSIEYQTSFGI